MNQKRCLTIQDYSCMGRCSLTVALPILSASKVETIGLPTAILSNHTAFSSWTYVDLTKEMKESVKKWSGYNHHFDSIYTGYLGTNQIPIVIDIIQELKEKDTFVLVDPAFGDNGKLYPGFDNRHIEEMKKLIAIADIICPNITEACYLTGEEYFGEELNESQKETLIKKLAALGPKKIVLTGIMSDKDHIGSITYDTISNQYDSVMTECYPGKYHGAGDSYASALVGALLNDIDLSTSNEIAHNFVHQAMKYDLDDQIDGLLYGLEFEKALPYYIKRIEEKK